MVDGFKTLALWPLQDLDSGRGKGKEADGGQKGHWNYLKAGFV